MSEPTTPEEAILDNLLGPKRVQIGNESVEQHSLKEQTEAANYLANKKAASNPNRGVRFTRIIPPGAG